METHVKNMNWRFKRQLIIFLVALGAFILASVLLFDFRGEANCFDGRKNGNETGVDCGGSCLLACAALSKPLLVRFARPFEAAPGVFNAVAYVENPNPRQAIFQISYEFRLYDSRDVLIAERIGKTFVPPNGRIVVFETDIRTFEREPIRAVFRFLEDPQWIQVDPNIVNLPISINDEAISSPNSTPRLSALLRNESIYVLRDISVAAILYDEFGNAVAASKTLLENIPRKENVPILFSWNKPFAAPPVRIEIIPEIDVFDLRL